MSYSKMASQTTQTRKSLVDILKLDMIGPENYHECAREILPERPDVWYITGFLVPQVSSPEERESEEDDQMELEHDPAGAESEQEVDKINHRKSYLPSSIGLSVLVPPGAETLKTNVSWGDYVKLGEPGEDDQSFCMELEAWAKEVGLTPVPPYLYGPGSTSVDGFARIPREESIELPIPSPDQSPLEYDLGIGRQLQLKIFSRQADGLGFPQGTRSVSIFLVNNRQPARVGKSRYPSYAFQVELELNCSPGFVARPNLQALSEGNRDWDERVADLQYRDVHEYVVGHNVASKADINDGLCDTVRSDWFPQSGIEKVTPVEWEGLELDMTALSTLDGKQAVSEALDALIPLYEKWLIEQAASSNSMTPAMEHTNEDLIDRARYASSRIKKGIELLKSDDDILMAFKYANKAMAKAAKEGIKKIEQPRWRTFQLAFFLLNIAGISKPDDSERDIVDLLFFPTGGGKTEAYLGIAAFTIVLRRLENPSSMIRDTNIPWYAGVTVLMRYTLRLLTLDQLGRAAALVIALELIRKEDNQQGIFLLGDTPFEIGLWVGSGATPNRVGRKGDKAPDSSYTAYSKWLAFANRDKDLPIPIRTCPWCGKEFDKDSFLFIDQNGNINTNNPVDMAVRCNNLECPTNDWDHLPIVTIDEAIYRRLPAFIIATIDKFAALPWTGQVGTLFGSVARYDAKQGFFGPSESYVSGVGMERHLPPPSLIIQDELHLISGPLGTIAGIYEIALEELCTTTLENGKRIKPKIIASTATVRRADRQIRALFGRQQSEIFPPQGPDRKDTFFAKTESEDEIPARLYMGISAPGRSVKSVALQILLSILSHGKQLYEDNGDKSNNKNPADPYLTLMYYFNSLRELGASRNMIEDQVVLRLRGYESHKRLYPQKEYYSKRELTVNSIQELSSRESTGKIAEAKRRLELPWGKKECVDIALATNMISVGLDITRLGLMLVNGQPKSAAEYIQSTSRVGRDSDRPGLVVTLLNSAKPRDRSHYERFSAWHQSFYRAVEATSVTPFAPRALDRALAAVLVGLVRQGHPGMASGISAHTILSRRQELEKWINPFSDRVEIYSMDWPEEDRKALVTAVKAQVTSLLDAWEKIAQADHESALTLAYSDKEKSGNNTSLLSSTLETVFAAPYAYRSKFRANRSMRDVQAPVIIRTKDQQE